MAETLNQTPLLEQHKKLGARLVPFAGYEMPIQYSGIVSEHTAVRTKAGLFDVCHMGEIRLRGQGAVALADWVATGDIQAAALGQAVYVCACNAAGTILDDLIVYKHGLDDVVIVCNASNRAKIVPHIQREAARFTDVQVVDESDETGLLALQGPLAFSILERADPSLADLKGSLRSFRFVRRSLLGQPVVIARTGYTGEDGVEIFCALERTERIWTGLLEAGVPLGLEPAGLGCRDTLRLEARLSLYGNEIDETTTPLEAGLAWTVKLNKPDFLGKSALLAAQAEGLTRTLVGFEMVGRGIARHGYPLLDSTGKQVGHCTSGSPSPTLGKSIGLGYLPLELAAVGTEFEVDCRGKATVARVVPTPFYRRPR